MEGLEASRSALPGGPGMQGTIGTVITTLLLAGLMTLAAATDARIAGAQEPPEGTVEVTYDTAEIEMVSLINNYREENGLEPLLVSDTASLAAKRHSEDMARYGFVDHATQQSAYFETGANFDERIDASGYDHDTARSENIAAGGDAEETFEGWRESPEHDQNMLDPAMKVIGIGLSEAGDREGSGGSYETYWTTDFGGHADGTAAQPSEVEVEEDTSAPDSEEQREEPGSEETAAGEQYGSGSGTSEDRDAAAGGEGAEPVSGESGDSGDRTESSEESAPGDQYSAGEEDSSTEESSGEETTGEETTTAMETTNDAGEGEEDVPGEGGGSPGKGSGNRDCDTLAGFDKGPFDSGFGSELAERIQAKVDCQLANAGIGGEDSEEGEDGEGGSTFTQEQTSSQQVDTRQSIGETAENGNAEESGEKAPDSGQGESGGGLLSGMFGGSGDSEEDAVAGASPDSEGSTGSSGEGGEDGSASESSSQESGDASVLGPASTEDLSTNNGRED